MTNKIKSCPRCHAGFECKPDDVDNCQCASAKLNQSQRDYIASRYDDCLCVDCLNKLHNQIDNQ